MRGVKIDYFAIIIADSLQNIADSALQVKQKTIRNQLFKCLWKPLVPLTTIGAGSGITIRTLINIIRANWKILVIGGTTIQCDHRGFK